jgi:Mg2+ and Co2+ transporter CorA
MTKIMVGDGKLLAEYDKVILEYFSDFRIVEKNNEFKKEVYIEINPKNVTGVCNDPYISLQRNDLVKGLKWRLEYKLAFSSTSERLMDQLLEQLMLKFTPYAEIITDNLGVLEIDIRKNMPEMSSLHKYEWIIGVYIK